MPAQLAVVGATIRTMDPDLPFASAVAVRDGVIVAVGDDACVRDACDGTTEVIDGTGWTLTPGLTDGHQHLLHGAELARGVSFDRVGSLDEVRAMLAAERARVGAGEFVVGYALEYAAFGGAPYHHDLIDAAAGEGPCLILSLDLHTVFANAHAIRLAGLTGREKFEDGSFMVCDDSGEPTGEAREMSAMFTLLSLRPTPSQQERLSWYADAIRAQNAVGITGIHQMDGSLDTAAVLADLEAAGDLGMRVHLHYLVEPTYDDDHLAGLAAARDEAGRRWRAHGVKFLMDGVIDTGTAWLEEPDTHGAGLDPMWPEHGRYQSAVRRFHDAGFAVTTHAIGDRAVREVLDTYDSLPSGGRRHRIEHVETAPDSTLRRFRPMGVTASMQPIHLRWLLPDLSDPWSQRLGHARCQHAMPSGDLSAAGALVVLGSDWPVAPYDPRLGFFAAQLRRAPDLADNGPIGASRPLSGLETLAGYTVNAARAVGDQGRAGVLKVGAQADLVAWGADPVTTPPEDVLELPCLLTIVDGTVVHRAEA
ncbi:amidohydrolase [Angustibacter sp. McL0619]|uniref:amidohydrolase n=1 Tax=Angustibacter sp. McL0619 TaxID=3415676 RepID=UPI003CEC3D0A